MKNLFACHLIMNVNTKTIKFNFHIAFLTNTVVSKNILKIYREDVKEKTFWRFQGCLTLWEAFKYQSSQSLLISEKKTKNNLVTKNWLLHLVGFILVRVMGHLWSKDSLNTYAAIHKNASNLEIQLFLR